MPLALAMKQVFHQHFTNTVSCTTRSHFKLSSSCMPLHVLLFVCSDHVLLVCSDLI